MTINLGFTMHIRKYTSLHKKDAIMRVVRGRGVSLCRTTTMQALSSSFIYVHGDHVFTCGVMQLAFTCYFTAAIHGRALR
jgi:hypothetical protein